MEQSDTIFHRIIRREIPADIVYEDDQVLAFKDINPVAPVHLLVIPKKSVSSLAAVEEEDKALLGHLMLTCSRLAQEHGLTESGYRVVTNIGQNASQSVFQLHFHVIGGRGFTWPPG